MGWEPSTGAKWRGRVPTPEEERALRKWTPPSAPGSSISATFKREAGMYTNGMWYGIKDEMKPGSLAIQASQTTDHCATSHLSDLTAGVDVGVYRFLDNPAWQFFTWDSDDGRGHLFHGTTDASTFSEYYIVCSDWQAGYTAFINRNWVRSHSTPWHGYVYLVKEAWSNSGIFTDDTYSAWFQKPRLYSAPDGLGETRWDNTINDQTYENPPMHMTRSLQQWPEGTMWTELIWVANP